MASSSEQPAKDRNEIAIKIKEYLSLVLSIFFYILVNFKYAAGRPVESLVETLLQMIETAPFVVGITILTVYFLQKLSDGRLLWNRIVRIYLTFGIIIGFLVNLYDYFSRA